MCPVFFSSLFQSIKDKVGLPALSTFFVGVLLGLNCVQQAEECFLSDDIKLAVLPVGGTLILTIVLVIAEQFRSSSKVKYYVADS